MPFQRPTLTALRLQTRQDLLNAGIPGVDAFLRFGVLPSLSEGQAGMAWMHYGYLDWIAEQAVPWTATDEYLAGWGALKGVFLKAAAIASSTAASWSVTGSAVIPSGTTVTRSDGWIYVTTADSVTTGTTTVAPITSMSAGAAGNALAGAMLTLGTPAQGVQTTGTLTAAATGGSDVETQDAFRTRVLAAYQAVGSAGSAQNYVDWALAVPGVTRAWVVRNGLGAGTVLVYVMLDLAESASGGFPVGTNGAASGEERYQAATGDQLAVADAIYPLQPVTPLVVVAAPLPQPTDFVISDLGSGNTVANQALIQAALQDMFLRLSSPGGKIDPDDWEEAIASISSVPTFNVSSPSAPVVGATPGSMPVLGSIAYAS